MGVRLPAEYQEVEYLESTGEAQWIDVGFPITDSLSMRLTFSSVTNIPNKYYMGVYNGNNGDFYLYSSSSKYQSAYGGPYHNTSVSLDMNKHTFDFSFDSDNAIVRENGSIISTNNKYSPLKSTSNIRIAGPHTSGQNKVRTYAFVAYSGENIIANFIPCYRKLDSKPGMYDLITNQFFTNAGTGEFLVGPDVIGSISPLMVAWRRALMMQKPIVPRGYAVVNKLISLGTNTLFPYIDTGIIPNSDYGFDITFETYSDMGGSNYGCIFGGRISSANKDFQLTTFCYNPARGGSLRWGDANLNQLDGTLTKDIKTRVVMDSNKYYVDGVEIGTLRSSFSGEVSIHLFGLSNSGTPTQHGLGCAIYNAKFFDDNGVLIRNYVPVVRKADGKPGLYDTVGKQFYVNASQTSVDFTWE